MTDVERTNCVETINYMMKENDIPIEILEKYKDTKASIDTLKMNYNVCCDDRSILIEAVSAMYEKFTQETNRETAYNWMVSNLGSEVLELCDIQFKRYKLVDVSMTATVAVPENFDEDQIIDCLLDCLLDRNIRYNCDFDICTNDEGLCEDDLMRHDFINEVSNFSDGDFI